MLKTSIATFLLTFLTVTWAGVEWLTKNPFELDNFFSGLPYSIALLLVLLAHEMGHFTAARIHKVDTTYPFFIPFPTFWGLNPFGTMGAVIRIRQQVPTKKALFDIASAGPIAGFAASLLVLILGFIFLPAKEYLYSIHPEYASLSEIPREGLTFGYTLGYELIAKVFAPSGAFVPPMNEIYHYPLLCVGWFGMLVTAMNLIPVGQLDGGHIAYCMFDRKYHVVAQASLIVMSILGLSGLLPLLGINWEFGWPGWLVWALVLSLLIKFGRLSHPATGDDSPIDPFRYRVGMLCWLIFVLSFSPNPFTI